MARDNSPARPGFRRRLPLELTEPELALLEAAEPSFGTKRATLVAGLRALTRLGDLERDLAATERECERAAKKADELSQREAELTAALAKEKTTSGTATKAKANATRSGERARAAEERAADLERRLAEERQARADLEAEFDELEDELFSTLRCPRCGSFAKPTDWAERRHDGQILVFHKPCGFHLGGLLDPTSVFGTRGP